MDKCCRTCKWFRNGECTLDEMKNDIENVIDEIVVDMLYGVKDPMIRKVISTIGDAMIERSVEKKFVPRDHTEFYCSYYE